MAIRQQFLLLIHILYCAAIIHGTLLFAKDAETCNLLCNQCKASALFTNGQCECSFLDSSNEDLECIQRTQKEIEAINLNVLPENLTDEERDVRSLKSRRRLRLGDADKVAQYFINGGPAAGHSHFVRAFNKMAYDNVNSTTNSFSGMTDESNPENEFHGVPLTSPISWITYDSPLYMVPEAASRAGLPTSSVETYPTIIETNPALGYPIGELYDSTSPLLGTITHHDVPFHHTLHRTITYPGHILHNLFTHRWYRHYPVYHGGIVRSINPLQDEISGATLAGRACENGDDSTTSNDFAIARNIDKPIAQNVAASIPGADSSQSSAHAPQIFSTSALYQPMQYRRYSSPYHYASHYNPLINILHPLTDEYFIQPVPNVQSDASNLLTSVFNPNSYCMNNVNTEQKSGKQFPITADKTVHFNDGTEKSNIVIKNDPTKEEKKIEKEGSNIS